MAADPTGLDRILAAGGGQLARPTRCRSCQAEVWMLKAVDTGRSAPIEVQPRPTGNVAVNLLVGVYTVLTRRELAVIHAAEREAGPVPLYVNHFGFCPQARSWRRR